jgi:hypothetical protein
MPLTACMKAHTERQLRVWLAYLRELENEHDLTALYLQHILAEVRRSWIAHPDRVQTEDHRLQFEWSSQPPEEEEEIDVEEATRQAKARWGLALGRQEQPARPPVPPQTGPPQPEPLEVRLVRARRAWPELYAPGEEG